MEMILLNDILKIFGLAVVVLYICHRFNISAIVGFLITGIIAGPHGLGMVHDSGQVELIAELGVIMLLFSIGIEFSFKDLFKMKKTIVLGGTVQVILSIIVTSLLAQLCSIPFKQAVFMGFLVSLSSTAIVLKEMEKRAELDSPHGKIELGILIYQDLIVVIMMFITPVLASGGEINQTGILILLKTAGLLISVLVLASYVVPYILYQVARTQSRELFLLCIIVICFSVAYLTFSAGLSLALGAFIAGLIISESEYSHQAMANILPFIDTFTSLFFVSIGMLLDTGIVFNHLGIVLLLTILLLTGKALIALLATLILGFPIRTAVLVGFALCQVGEFSFILSQAGLEYNLISGVLYQGFLSAAILTMMVTPFLMDIAPKFAEKVSRWPLPEKLRSGGRIEESKSLKIKQDHLIIVGYGVNGRNLARAARTAQIPYTIIEMNSDTVRLEKARGQDILYGDATHKLVLKQAGIENARIIVVAIHDSAASRRITDTARRLNPGIYILVRTRFVVDMYDLYKLGANEVIPEEYETSVEIFARVLTRYMVPRDKIEEYISRVRREDYDMFRSINKSAVEMDDLHDLHLTDIDLSTIEVSNSASIIEKKIGDIELRSKYGVSLLLIYRGNELISNPGADVIIKEGDYLVMMGKSTDVNNVIQELF